MLIVLLIIGTITVVLSSATIANVLAVNSSSDNGSVNSIITMPMTSSMVKMDEEKPGPGPRVEGVGAVGGGPMPAPPTTSPATPTATPTTTTTTTTTHTTTPAITAADAAAAVDNSMKRILLEEQFKELQDLTNRDSQCNREFDKTIITWENIVDRTKSIVESLQRSHAETTTETSSNTTSDTTVTVTPPPPGPPGPPSGTTNTVTRDINTGTSQTDIDVFLESLDITKNTDIDKRDHTTITGTDKKDYIIGSSTDDLICSEGGNDIVFSQGGVDAIFTNGGMNTVQGGEDDNQIFGGDNGDSLIGGVDDDLIVARGGDDRLLGEAGNDVLEGGKGGDYFDCGEGTDLITDFNPAEGDVIAGNCELF